MRTFLIIILSACASGSFAQRCEGSYGSDIVFDENALRELKLHRVKKLSTNTDETPPYCTEEWEFSPTGKLAAFRTYWHMSDEADPYPMLPATVMQSQQDTAYFDGPNGTKSAQCVNYCFLNTYGIWRRSFYYPAYGDMRYNEMQYAFDADSNLIYYRSQMDYARPNSIYALQWLIRYDTLGNITERIGYAAEVSEGCANWYPQFDTAQYESITYDYEVGIKTHISWEKDIWQAELMYRYFDNGCDHCVGNRGEARIETRPIEQPDELVVQSSALPLSRKERRRQRKDPAVTFRDNRVIIAHRLYAVEYW